MPPTATGTWAASTAGLAATRGTGGRSSTPAWSPAPPRSCWRRSPTRRPCSTWAAAPARSCAPSPTGSRPPPATTPVGTVAGRDRGGQLGAGAEGDHELLVGRQGQGGGVAPVGAAVDVEVEVLVDVQGGGFDGAQRGHADGLQAFGQVGGVGAPGRRSGLQAGERAGAGRRRRRSRRWAACRASSASRRRRACCAFMVPRVPQRPWSGIAASRHLRPPAGRNPEMAASRDAAGRPAGDPRTGRGGRLAAQATTRR